MKLSVLTLSLPIMALLLSCNPTTNNHKKNNKVIIGYVPGYMGVIDAKAIDAKKLTHINYAFVDVKDSMTWLTNEATDTVNFRNLVALKKSNPDLKVLISIGGWGWSNYFSDAVLTHSSREKFAKTGVEIVKKFDLDGIDIDWEYPNQHGEDNVYRPEDKQNYTLMFKAIRKELDALSQQTKKTYLISTAVGGDKSYIENTEMNKVGKIVDYVNLMTYDYFTQNDSSGHHTNLYPPNDYEKDHSAQKTFDIYLDAGVPREKLVMGIAFYGRGWYVKSGKTRGINTGADSTQWVGGYSYIKDSLMKKPGYKLYWDDNAKAAYLFNAELKNFISFDDERSVGYKCRFAMDNGMAGVMFWQYMSDPKEYLLDEINTSFHYR